MTMIDISKPPEEVLDKYWLYVWRNLVECYWNWLRKPDEDNDQYYRTTGFEKPCYTFASLRKRSGISKESIDEDVAGLARNFWARNRVQLKEYFINWTCEKWNTILAVEKDMAGGWIDCGVDPVYPDSKHKAHPQYAPYLAKTGELQAMLNKSRLQVFFTINEEAFQKHKQLLHRRRIAKLRLMKIRLKRSFKKIAYCVKI